VNESTPTLLTFLQTSKNRSSELSATLGCEAHGSGMRVSTEDIGETVDEVSSNNQTVRNEAEGSISFVCNVYEKVREQAITKTEGVDLEAKVRELVLIVSEFREDSSGWVVVRHSIS